MARQVRTLAGWPEAGHRLVMMRTVEGELERLARLVDEGALKVPLDAGGEGREGKEGGAYPFTAEGCAAAFARLKSRRTCGKISVTF